MSGRIAQRFAQLRQAGRKGLIPFCTAGDPDPQQVVPLLHTLVAAGADLLELGVPFSDPMADGAVIQRSSERALRQGMTLPQVLRQVQVFRQDDATTPIVLMGYMNPVEAMGLERFARQAAAAGVDGVLLVDLPPEEATAAQSIFRTAELDMIWMIAPTTAPARMRMIAGQAQGFIYYVSLKGVTGSAAFDAAPVAPQVTAIREYTAVPVAVGFGIRDVQTAVAMAVVADAVVVGSTLVECMEAVAPEGNWQGRAYDFIAALRQGLDACTEVSA